MHLRVTNLHPYQTECMPISHLEFKDDIFPGRENSVLAPGKYEAFSPVKQKDLFSDKENVTPASKVKPILRSPWDKEYVVICLLTESHLCC